MPLVVMGSTQGQQHPTVQRWVEIGLEQTSEDAPGLGPIVISFVGQDAFEVGAPGCVARLFGGQSLQFRQYGFTPVQMHHL